MRYEKSIKKVTEEVLRFQGKRVRHKWFNEECRNYILEKDDAKTRVLKNLKP